MKKSFVWGIVFLLEGAILQAQLPPTLHRIAERDTAIDMPDESRLFPRGGVEITVPPGSQPPKEVPAKAISEEHLATIFSRLGLQSVRAEMFREGVRRHWGEHFCQLEMYLAGKNERGDAVPPRGATEQVYDPQALILPTEKHPAEIVLRRLTALLDSLENPGKEKTAALKTLRADVEKCRNFMGKEPADDLFFALAALRRQAMFLHPDLTRCPDILFCARASYAGSRLTNWFNSDRTGGHFTTQVYGFNTVRGGGLFRISGWQLPQPEVTDLLADRKVSETSREKRLVGKTLTGGAFMAPDVSYDGKTVYFSHCASREHCWKWTPETTWNLFKYHLETGELHQLTDGPYNDFDVCELPGGRLVFISERRGGFIRCFGESADLRVTTSVLHSMKPDGSDLYPISYFETSEWQPSVDHQGMLVYTRWDYTDRENCLGSQFWTCFPDGRNPRAPHGNYPQPWHTFPDNRFDDTRFGFTKTAPSGLPMAEMQIRAIPGSHRYVLLAAPHHGETYGSICVLDLREKNDFHMSQLRRVTPYQPFPESECRGRSQYRYGAPWPLSEDTFLCNSWEDLVVLDRFGNEELICERELLPIGYDPRLRLSDPIPLQARPKPPVIPQQTTQGEDFQNENRTATLGIVDVRLSDQPFPPERPIRYLRIFQVIPKPNPWMNQPNIGFAPENTPRIPLGYVPVEEDGSVLVEVPHGKQLLFQVLDENFQAVQTMRAVTFLHPGERLLCTGCHEPQEESVELSRSLPIAFQKPPQKLQVECDFPEPINFYRLIQPVVQTSCIPCHVEKNLPFQKMEHEDFRPYVFYFAGGMQRAIMTPHFGGSRSIPGRCGAGGSRLSQILKDENHQNAVSDEVRHKFTLWMDANAPRLGAFHSEEKQKQGELVLPILDMH
ncbi:MAG: hypothetical protein Q4D62_08840 [Planctomycetia bacterium]|nr:hypothetical protein [Planctomycetia bacterium]